MVVYISLTGCILGSYSPAWYFNDDQIADNYIYIFAFPGIIALSRLVLIFILFFRIQTPTFIVSKAGPKIEEKGSSHYKKLSWVLSTIYSKEDVPKVAQNLIVANKKKLESGEANIGVKDLFGKRYRNAFFIAIMVNIIQ